MTKAYILGALHDGTKRRNTFRISQKSKSYIKFLAKSIKALGYNAWIYKEGKNRNLYIVEFSKFVLDKTEINSTNEKIDYLKGYFDAEGGIAKNQKVRYYLYFAQKNLSDLKKVKKYLTELKIETGKIHNPSKTVDPNYWRFYIRANSYEKFAEIIGSDHPIKSHFLRMKR